MDYEAAMSAAERIAVALENAARLIAAAILKVHDYDSSKRMLDRLEKDGREQP